LAQSVNRIIKPCYAVIARVAEPAAMKARFMVVIELRPFRRVGHYDRTTLALLRRGVSLYGSVLIFPSLAAMPFSIFSSVLRTVSRVSFAPGARYFFLPLWIFCSPSQGGRGGSGFPPLRVFGFPPLRAGALPRAIFFRVASILFTLTFLVSRGCFSGVFIWHPLL
jgi:hypothetical protein